MTNPFSRSVAYNDLPPLPPRVELETKATLKAAVRARTALADLRGAAKSIPNQSILVRAAILQEAKSSSEIENIVTTNDELYRALSRDDHGDDPQTREVLHYESALWHGFNRLAVGSEIDAKLIREIASIVLGHEVAFRSTPGTRIGNAGTGEVAYTPPDRHDRIRELLENLCSFMHSSGDLEPVIALAVAHYQFEAIHPFPDSNGRTGRVLNILFLFHRQLLDLPILFLSRAILESRSDYYARLQDVTERGEWEAWILYVLDALEHTAVETRRRIEAIRRAIEEAKNLARVAAPKVYSAELIDLVFSQPYTRIAFLESAGIAKRQTAATYLRELERIGLLRSARMWREVLFLNDNLLQILSA